MSADVTSLLDRARRKDAQAWSHLYDTYYPRIYGFIMARVSDSMLAEDLAADVFISALKAIGSYEERGHGFAAWLYRIAHNRLIDHYRHSGRRESESLDAHDDDGVLVGNAPTTGGEPPADHLDLHAAMQRLTPEQRQVVHLRFIEGLTSDQVAGVMSKSTAAVKIIQHRALRLLKRTLLGPVSQ